MIINYAPGRWHSRTHPFSTAAQLQRVYSTPRAWFRRSVMTPAVNSDSDRYADEQYITAAAVFPRGSLSIQQVVDSVSWAVIIFWPGRDYSIVLVSVADRQAWVNLCESLRASAWYVIADDEGQVYTHSAAVELSGYVPITDGRRRGSKNLDHEQVRDDLVRGYYTDSELAELYDVTRQTIANIRKKYNLKAHRAVKVQTTD